MVRQGEPMLRFEGARRNKIPHNRGGIVVAPTLLHAQHADHRSSVGACERIGMPSMTSLSSSLNSPMKSLLTRLFPFLLASVLAAAAACTDEGDSAPFAHGPFPE